MTRIVCAIVMALLLGMPRNSEAQRAATAAGGTVLFICEHGSVRSVIATLMFDEFAKAAGLPMRASSRGTVVDSIVPPWLQKKLADDRLVLGAFTPRALSTADLANASMIVSFDLPASTTSAARAPRAQWDGLPSVSQDYVSGRDAIKVRVRRLVDSLAQVKR